MGLIVEKIFEQSLDKPLSLNQTNIGQLKKRYLKQKNKYGILCSWNQRDHALTLKSDRYRGLEGRIKFTNRRVVGYLEAPLWIRFFLWKHKDEIVRLVRKEINFFTKHCKYHRKELRGHRA